MLVVSGAIALLYSALDLLSDEGLTWLLNLFDQDNTS